MALLETHNLEVSFDGFKAVDELNFSVDEGELRCLIGANGAGKSTTLDLICGQTMPTSGTIIFEGHDITDMHEHRRARHGIGRKFQVPSIFKELTARQNLQVANSKLPSPWHNMFVFPGSERRDRIEEIALFTGISDRLDTQAAFLSHGETQWLEIAMLIVQDSKMILMDEPTAGMTISETGKTAEIFNQMRGQHTLVVVEHDMAFVREIAQVVTVLHQGKVLSQGSVSDIETDERVKEAYLGSGGISHA